MTTAYGRSPEMQRALRRTNHLDAHAIAFGLDRHQLSEDLMLAAGASTAEGLLAIAWRLRTRREHPQRLPTGGNDHPQRDGSSAERAAPRKRIRLGVDPGVGFEVGTRLGARPSQTFPKLPCAVQSSFVSLGRSR